MTELNRDRYARTIEDLVSFEAARRPRRGVQRSSRNNRAPVHRGFVPPTKLSRYSARLSSGHHYCPANAEWAISKRL